MHQKFLEFGNGQIELIVAKILQTVTAVHEQRTDFTLFDVVPALIALGGSYWSALSKASRAAS